MIVIRLGTRTDIEGLLVGATNLDIDAYEAGGKIVTGPTVTLSIPDKSPAIVGKDSRVRIGGRTFVVGDIVIADNIGDCKVCLRPTIET